MANQENLLPFISAMIVARNESAYIEKSLNSLINQTYPKDRYEILLIDGNSNDNTVEIAKNTVRSYCEKRKQIFNIKFLETLADPCCWLEYRYKKFKRTVFCQN